MTSHQVATRPEFWIYSPDPTVDSREALSETGSGIILVKQTPMADPPPSSGSTSGYKAFKTLPKQSPRSTFDKLVWKKSGLLDLSPHISNTYNARYILSITQGQIPRRNASDFLNKLDRSILEIQLRYLPPLDLIVLSDGSVILEWTTKHWRIGFGIETNSAESSWYLVSDKTLGRVDAGGVLDQVDIAWLLHWVMAHPYK